MKYQKVLDMSNRFIALAGENPEDVVGSWYQSQRQMLLDFYYRFKTDLLIVIKELGGEIYILKNRGFNKDMMKLLIKTRDDISNILIEIKDQSPYKAAEDLIHYVLERPNVIT